MTRLRASQRRMLERMLISDLIEDEDGLGWADSRDPVFPETVRSLEEMGLIESEAAASLTGQRQVQYYTVTDAGRAALGKKADA